MADEGISWTPGTQLKRWRQEAGIKSTTDAAKLFGLSQSAISAWENSNLPNIKRARMIDEAYGLKPGMTAALLSGDSPPTGLAEPRVIDIVDGRLVWSGQFAYDTVIAALHGNLTDEQRAELIAIDEASE